MRISRRVFLKRVGWVTCGIAGSALPGANSFASTLNDKTLSFRSLHTGEKVKVTFWSRGGYVANALNEVDYIMRDWRTGEVFAVDTALLELLFDLRVRLHTRAPYRIISGFRSLSTNAKLARRSRNVARRSLHMAGMAIDTALSGVDTRQIRDAALGLKRGGVGYYAKADFVHIDTGRVRRW